MGLGGVAIAVSPYVIHPKTAVLGRAGGGILHGNFRLEDFNGYLCTPELCKLIITSEIR